MPPVETKEHRTLIVPEPGAAKNIRFCRFQNADPVEIAEVYEAGDILIFEDVPVPCELTWLRTIPLGDNKDRAIKKAKMHAMMAPVSKEHFSQHLLRKLFNSWRDACRFQDLVRAATVSFRGYVSRLFPSYVLTGDESHSWRATETFPEGMHVDSYSGNNDENHRLRLFYNYDDIPRIWSTGPIVDDLLRQFGPELLAAGKFKGHPPNEINNILNNEIPWSTVPQNQIFFAPGTLWIADSQIASHEIIHGRRAMTYTYTVNPSSLRHPDRNFQNRVRAVVSKLGE